MKALTLAQRRVDTARAKLDRDAHSAYAAACGNDYATKRKTAARELRALKNLREAEAALARLKSLTCEELLHIDLTA